MYKAHVTDCQRMYLLSKVRVVQSSWLVDFVMVILNWWLLSSEMNRKIVYRNPPRLFSRITCLYYVMMESCIDHLQAILMCCSLCPNLHTKFIELCTKKYFMGWIHLLFCNWNYELVGASWNVCDQNGVNTFYLIQKLKEIYDDVGVWCYMWEDVLTISWYLSAVLGLV